MQTTGIITDTAIDLNTSKLKISLVLDTNNKDDVMKLKNENKLNIDLKKYREKRKLDSNSYCWVLCDKIAKVLSKDGTIVSKEDIYKDSVQNFGVFIPFIVEEKAFEKFKEVWEKQGLGYQVQETSRKNKCVRVNCYYGSSSYDTKEMSRLVDSLVQEAKVLGIETRPQEEIESMLKEWK